MLLFNPNQHGYISHVQMFQRMAAIVVTGDHDPAVDSGKPAPDINLKPTKRLNVDPTECQVEQHHRFMYYRLIVAAPGILRKCGFLIF